MPEIEKFIPTELDGNSRYAIRVKSINSFGVSSDWSETLIVDTEEAGAPTGGRLILTANGLIAYDSNGQTKMVYSGEDSAIRVNDIVNPSFEIDTTGWTTLDNTTLSRTLTDYYVGEPDYLASGQVTCMLNDISGIGFVTDASNRVAASPGDVITASAYIKAPVNTVSVKIGIRFYDAGGNLLKETASYSARIIPVDGNWYRVSVVAATAPNLTVETGFVIYSTSTMTNGQFFYVDGILMENAPTLNDYFDGSTSIGATVWNGAAHNSSSTFDLTASYYVDGGVFTAGTLQTAVDVGEGATPISGVKMSKTGIQGYSGLQATPSFSLDTQGKFRVGGTNNYIYWDGATLTVVGAISAGTIDIGGFDSTSFHVDATGSMWVGAGTFASAPFKVSASGSLTVTGGSITGATIQTASSGKRIVLSGTTLTNYGDGDDSPPQIVFDTGGVLTTGAGIISDSNLLISAAYGSIVIGDFAAGVGFEGNLYYGPYRHQFSVNNSLISPFSGFLPAFTISDTYVLVNDPFPLGVGIIPVSGARLHVEETEASTNATIHLTHSSAGSTISDGMSLVVTSSGIAYIIQRGNNDLRFRTNNTTDVARFTSIGEFRFNNNGSAGSPIISFTGDTNTGIYRRAADDIAIVANGADRVIATATTVFVTLAANGGETASVRYDAFGGLHVQASNRDLKDNIKDLSGTTALKLINEFKPKTFTWKPLETDTKEQAALRPLNPSVGFIAEEVAELGKDEGLNLAEWKIPADPKDIDDFSKWQVSYWKEAHVIALLVGSVQELNKRIVELENNVI